jgi:hypothetical protein
MLVFNGAFQGKKMGQQTYYTPYPMSAGQATALYTPYPGTNGWPSAPRIVLPPSPVAMTEEQRIAVAEESAPHVPMTMIQSAAQLPPPAPVPSSVVLPPSPAAARTESAFPVLAAVVGGGALLAALIA